MNWLGQLLGSEWELFPAGGATGDAFLAKHNGQKLFLKRNSSPFLAVLSAEGIVPKLVWTKRMENGDVITAQHWLSGRELKPKDMEGKQVAELLKKIHSSKELVDMLKRLGKNPLTPDAVVEQLKYNFTYLRYSHPLLERALRYLEGHIEQIRHSEKVVCHSDLNHNNWLLADNDQLYLIDWDGAVIADPAIDLGPLLYHYIAESEWQNWLLQYGVELTSVLRLRMLWYVLADTLSNLFWAVSKENENELHQTLKKVETLLIKLESQE
ncbi:phosphotransferase family protein [Bacillus gobiensis]|uniref:phosphotransferase n=1 Tax=Bacillus gobiensis TaxID=1441095 RepID=UPI003D25D5FB